MNILDLKKLMLVPLACCILVQQTDAATMEVNDEKFKVSYKDSPKDIEDKFLKWVEHEEETGASERVTDQNGRKEKIKTNLRVAFDVVTRCGLDWKECQLGGVVASVRDNDRCGLCGSEWNGRAERTRHVPGKWHYPMRARALHCARGRLVFGIRLGARSFEGNGRRQRELGREGGCPRTGQPACLPGRLVGGISRHHASL